MANKRVAELAKLLKKYKDAYYNGTPLVSDAAYDALEDELRELDPQHALFATVGAPATRATAWEKARHAIPMGSLNKAVSEDELHAWVALCDKLGAKGKLASIADDLIVTEKLDGLSLAVTYDRGALTDAITRGDGLVGERILSNARRMKGVPAKLAKPISVTVRGEIILKLSDMKKAFPGAANPRNQASGTSKRLDGEGCEHLTVLFYDLDGAGEDHATEANKLARIEALGLGVPSFSTTDLAGAIDLHRSYAKTKRAKLDYEIDGLVVRANDTHVSQMHGELSNRPRAAIAFKFASQAKVTTLLDVIWEAGSSGRVTPVAIFEPVNLAGANVQRTSLHTAGNVAELGLCIGDSVLISRRNDVIPYLEEVVASNGGEAVVAPTKCPTCTSKLEKLGEFIACRNSACTALVEGRIQNWIDALGVLEWGEKLIAQLVESELVAEPADLYRLTAEQIASLERRGLIIGQKVLDNLRAKLPITLPRFLAALGIENVGLQTTKAVVGAGYDTIAKVKGAKLDAIAAIGGVGPAKARAFVDGIASRSDEIDRLIDAGVEPVSVAKAGGLAGKTFCFTGALSRPRKEYEDMVESRGGTLLGGVTKELQYLVMADPESGSSKAQKAKQLGTACIDEAAFLALLDAAPAPTTTAVPATKPAPAAKPARATKSTKPAPAAEKRTSSTTTSTTPSPATKPATKPATAAKPARATKSAVTKKPGRAAKSAKPATKPAGRAAKSAKPAKKPAGRAAKSAKAAKKSAKKPARKPAKKPRAKVPAKRASAKRAKR